MNRQRLRSKIFAACSIAIAVSIIFRGNLLSAAEGPWLTGELLKKGLNHKIDLAWSNIPLREALAGFEKSQKIAVLLDRRVDPGQKIELSFENVPVTEAIPRIASRAEIGSTILGPVAYFGPATTAERLATVAALRKEDIEKLPVATRQRWSHLKNWKWDDLATPRDLLASLAKDNGLRIEGLDRIPHDLWAAADLPPISLADRLTLLLCQFDLTFEPAADGASIRLVPMPEKPLIERTYNVAKPADEAAAQLRQMKLLADAEIHTDGSKLVVRGRQEDHDAIAEILSGQTAHRTAVTESRKVYSLRVELTVNQLLKSLGPKMDVEFHVDQTAIAAAGLSLDKTVKLDVKEVGADELLRAVLDPAGLTFQRHGNMIDVKPK